VRVSNPIDLVGLVAHEISPASIARGCGVDVKDEEPIASVRALCVGAAMARVMIGCVQDGRVLGAQVLGVLIERGTNLHGLQRHDVHAEPAQVGPKTHAPRRPGRRAVRRFCRNKGVGASEARQRI
jgi:hypothetical protein